MRLRETPGIMLLCMLPALLTGACGDGAPERQKTSESDYLTIGENFTRALASRDYEKAYAMTSLSYKAETPLPGMKEAFEVVVPPDWGETEPVQASVVSKKWPAMNPDDVAMVYVSIYGDVYSEGATVVVTMEKGELVIREVEFGRP